MAGNYYPPFSLRVSEDLLDKVKYIAENNKRSANKEIEFAFSAASGTNLIRHIISVESDI